MRYYLTPREGGIPTDLLNICKQIRTHAYIRMHTQSHTHNMFIIHTSYLHIYLYTLYTYHMLVCMLYVIKPFFVDNHVIIENCADVTHTRMHTRTHTRTHAHTHAYYNYNIKVQGIIFEASDRSLSHSLAQIKNLGSDLSLASIAKIARCLQVFILTSSFLCIRFTRKVYSLYNKVFGLQ